MIIERVVRRMLLIGKETDVEEDDHDSTAFQKKVDAIDASQHNRNVIDTTISIQYCFESSCWKMTFAVAIMYVQGVRFQIW